MSCLKMTAKVSTYERSKNKYDKRVSWKRVVKGGGIIDKIQKENCAALFRWKP